MSDDVWIQIETLYRTRLSTFVRVARAVTGERESALEAVQEGFADALRHASRWERRGTLEAWVWRCVVNRARKARPIRTQTITVEAHEDERRRDDDLRERIATLPERQRLVVFLRYFADRGYREIAQTLEIEVGTVAATLSAAHASLRAALLEVPV
jgi:RNA polymerase sigma-70 factor, ECF subfamily